jgi:hypothetical protein
MLQLCMEYMGVEGANWNITLNILYSVVQSYWI